MARRLSVPTYNANRGSIRITPDVVESVRREVVQSDLSTYQARYNIIEFLNLSKDRTYKSHTLKGSPLMWQADKACEVDPMGNLTWGSRIIDPTRLRSFMKFCPHKEVYDTLFRSTINWERSGRQNAVEFMAVIKEVLKEDLVMLTQGLLAVTFLGQLFDYNTLGFRGSATPQEQSDFKKQANVFKGLLKQIQDSPVSTMYQDGIFPEAIPEQGYTDINISTVATSLLGTADAELKRLVAKGSDRDGRGGTVQPILLVSSNLIPDMWKLATTIADKTAQNRGLLQEIRVETINGKNEYFWRNVPIVPLDEFCIYDDYLNNGFYFAALTSTKNIQVGSNFRKFDDVEDSSVGVTYQRVSSDDIKGGDAGAYYRDTHALLGVDIANPRLINSTWMSY